MLFDREPIRVRAEAGAPDGSQATRGGDTAMGKKQDEQAMDAATVAILRNLDRVGKQRDVLNELTPREQQLVFEAEARHNRRR